MSYLTIKEDALFKVLRKVKKEHQAIFTTLTLTMFVYERYNERVEQCAVYYAKEIYDAALVDEVINEWFIEEFDSHGKGIGYKPIVDLVEFVDDGL